MLPAALIIAGLFATSPRVAVPSATCPSGPEATFVAGARACPALEISGSIDARGASIDPAFDVTIAPSEFARPVEGAVLAGYAGDGRRLFALPIAAGGAFHLYVPLAPTAQQMLARIVLSSNEVRAERVAAAHGEPEPEIISVDDGRAIVAWNAHAFPAIRVHDALDRPPVAAGSGTSTFEQMTVDTHARRVSIDFSDGVRSVTRAYAIFGR